MFGMTPDDRLLAAAYEFDSSHDRPHPDAGRAADLIDEAQEDDGGAGPDNENSLPQTHPVGLRVSQVLMPGQFPLTSGPFRPPRLFQ